jgi:hypothetical protein
MRLSSSPLLRFHAYRTVEHAWMSQRAQGDLRASIKMSNESHDTLSFGVLTRWARYNLETEVGSHTHTVDAKRT